MSVRRSGALLGAAGVVATMAGFGAYQAANPSRGLDVPKAVSTAIEKFFGAGGHEPQRVLADGVNVWIVTGSKDGNPTTLTLSNAGQMQEVAQDMPFRDLPAPVQAKLRSAYPKVKFDRVQSVEFHLFRVGTQGDEHTPEVLVFAAGNRLGEPVTHEPGMPGKWQDEDN